MANFIKNRLQILGPEGQVKALLNRFSTHFEKAPNRSCDGELIYKNKETNGVGWLNETTKMFKRRDKEDVAEIPDGFEQDFTEAWSRFPDFDKIIKMPESLNITSDGWVEPMENQFSENTKFKAHLDELKKHCEKHPTQKTETINNFIGGVKNYIEYGSATWHNWSCKNWGTKWNCSECEKINENTFDFQTAWVGVPNLIKLMSKEFPEVSFVYEFADEDTGCNCGSGIFKNGESDFRELENSSKEAYELAFKLRPDRAEDYKLVGEEYQYIDSEKS